MIHTGQLEGFPAVTLSNGEVEAVFVPMLGGRLASLKAVGGRSWCFSPGDRLQLWANRPGDPFTTGTFVGLDECLPTITACRVDGRDLPDHGSCWNHPWELLPGDGVGLGLDLPDLPLRLERRATLRGTTLRLDYALTNRGDRPERWGWAFHGLLALAPGDRIELPGVESVRVAAQRLAEPLSLPTWAWPSPRPDLPQGLRRPPGRWPCRRVGPGWPGTRIAVARPDQPLVWAVAVPGRLPESAHPRPGTDQPALR